MSKKILSMVLALSMTLSLCGTVFAAGDVQGSDTLYLQDDGHGQYSVTNKRSGNTVVARATENEGIYHLQDEKYVTMTSADSFLLADKLEIDVDNLDANDALYEQYQISDEIVKDIEKRVEDQKAQGNNDFDVSIFAPSHIDTVGTRAVSANYSYNGYTLRDTAVVFVNSGVTAEKYGTSVLSTMKQFFSIGMSVAGGLSEAALFTAYGYLASAYDVYKIFRGEVTYGSTSDWGNARTSYNLTNKWTEVYYGGTWYFGCSTQMAYLVTNITQQHYTGLTGGEPYSIPTTLNQIMYSNNFNNSAQVAVQHFLSYGYTDPALYIKLFTTTCYL